MTGFLTSDVLLLLSTLIKFNKEEKNETKKQTFIRSSRDEQRRN